MPSRSTVFPYVPLNDITTTTTTTNNNNNDMYSSITSKLSLPPSSSSGGRHRSGSVTLPSDNTTNQGFGTTLFNSTSFSPYQIMEESASDTVASTLASLGLDDNTNGNNSNNHNNISNNNNNNTGVNNITTTSTTNATASTTTAITSTSLSTPTQHIQQRHRAYTVSTRTPSTKGDELSDLLPLNFSPFSPQTRSSVMQRPRAISLGMADDPHFDDDDNNTNLSRFSPFGMSSLQPTLSSVSQQQQSSTSSRLAQQYLSDTTTSSQQSLRISRSSGNLLDLASRNDFIENNLSDDINPMDDTMPSVSSSTSALLDSPSSSATQIPSRALWLGNINPSVSVNDLMQQFSLYGQVESARILSDKECGFVNFINVESAIAAKNDLETRLGSKLAGTSVRVGYGKADVTLAMALTNEAGPNAQGPTRALWVGNIPSNINTAILHAIFQAFGPIESIRVLSHKNCGFINFEHQEDAVLARKHLQNKEILGPGTGTVRIGFAKAPTAEEMSNGDYVTFNTASSPQPLAPPLPLQPFSYYPQQQQTTLQQRSPPPQPYMAPIYPGQHGYPVVSQGIIQQQGLTMISPMMPTPTNHMANYNYSSNNNNNNNNSHNNNHHQQHNNNNNNNKNNHSKNKNNNTNSNNSNSNNDNSNNNGNNSNSNVPIDTYQAAQWATAMMMTTMMMNASGQQSLTQPSLYTAITAERQFIMQQLGSNPDDSKQEDRIPISYYSVIPSVPELSSDRILEPLRLRDMRKRLESGQGLQDIEIIAHECMNEIVELCSDYIGNTVVQKLFEHCVDSTKHMMLERIAPYLAAIGVHKNGTWAAQKIIDYASTPGQIQLIRQHVAPYVPLLLLDQFGNYVVQCCLRMGPEHNQYIFDAIVDKCWEIGQGRFGARAVRAILENPIVTKKQQIYCAGAIAQNAVLLTTNANGTLLLIWLLDTSDITGRYRVLCPRLIPHLGKLCTHKLGSLTVYKMIQQEEDKESSHLLLNTLANDANLLQEILQDQIHGVAFLQKVLALSSLANTKQRAALVNQIRDGLEKLGLLDVQGYKKLIEELDTQSLSSSSPIFSNDESSSTVDNSNNETEHNKNNNTTIATSPSIITNEDTIQKETIENNNTNVGIKGNEPANQQTSVIHNSSTSPPSSSTLSSPSTSSPSLSSSSSTMDMSMWMKNPQAVAMMANMYAAAMTAATTSTTTTTTTAQQQQQPTLPVNVPELPQFEHILKSLLPNNTETNIKDSKKVVDDLIQQDEEKKDE
ncbi:unnamed protein product [Cunninghamella echinulata]